MTGEVSSLTNDLLRIAGDNPFLLLGMCAFTSLILIRRQGPIPDGLRVP
jgi:hypothetical protein